jgi:hypothetical protein
MNALLWAVCLACAAALVMDPAAAGRIHRPMPHLRM